MGFEQIKVEFCLTNISIETVDLRLLDVETRGQYVPDVRNHPPRFLACQEGSETSVGHEGVDICFQLVQMSKKVELMQQGIIDRDSPSTWGAQKQIESFRSRAACSSYVSCVQRASRLNPFLPQISLMKPMTEVL